MRRNVTKSNTHIHYERLPDHDVANEDEDDKKDKCLKYRCPIESPTGKMIADIAVFLLILVMLAGVGFSCHSVALVYMRFGSTKSDPVVPHVMLSRHRRDSALRKDEHLSHRELDTDDLRAGETRRQAALRRDTDAKKLSPPDPYSPLPPSAELLHVFRQAAVNSDAHECSDIGKAVLLPPTSGNAVDAALATLFCNGLVTMQSMGLGGGFVANVFIAQERRSYALNAREKAPEQNGAEHADRSADDMAASIGVPGEALGYAELHERFGSRPWSELWAPTVQLCRHGFRMSTHMRNWVRPVFREDWHLFEMFYDRDRRDYRQVGDTLRPPRELCDFYELIAAKGGRDFYNGSAADIVLDDLRDMDAPIGRDDLRAYSVRWTESLRVPIGPKDEFALHVTPAPSSGSLVAMMMRILSGFESTGRDDESVAVYRLIETYKWAYAKRMLLGDPEFVERLEELEQFITSAEWTQSVRDRIENLRTNGRPKTEDRLEYYEVTELDMEYNRYGTAHVSVIAPNGDAVSVTSSINFYFGNGRMGRRSGLIFNTANDDFNTGSATTNYFALPPCRANERLPGKRPMSSMAPVIVTDGDHRNVLFVGGAAGGSKIPSALVGVLVRTLLMGESLKQAVDAPRLHHQLLPMELAYEYGIVESMVERLRQFGHHTYRYTDSGSISVVTALTRNESGVFGVADYRKRGDVKGF